MDRELERILEYDKIRSLLAAEASGSLGREMAAALQPASILAEIEGRLEETAQALRLMEEAMIPFGGLHDIRPQLQAVKKDAVMESEDLLPVMETLYAMRQVKRYLKETAVEAPLLKEWGKEIEIQGQLERRLENAVDAYGRIRDDATPELARIRKGARNIHSQIKSYLNTVLHSPEYKKFFQDSIITMRENRYVLPVKQEYRQAFPGIIHDQSATGATLFVEPMRMVEMNNEAKKLALAERQEIQRILRSLSAQIAQCSDALLQNLLLLGRLDFTFAKAKLARRMRAIRPRLNDEGRTELKRARHPLLAEDKVVPIDIVLGGKNRILLITGPNTGGKTVSLKTMGLFSLMIQSGCFVPAESGSEMAVYRNIYADIGDEQSIEQSLSTFSAHMKHIVAILQEIGRSDLLLVDEIGAGTDPQEGAALAMAILEHLLTVGASVIATTHYPELKTFAYSREGIENACVEFDIDTLQPTYRLLIGIPGASNAFAISTRLGLAEDLVSRAKALIRSDHAAFERIIQSLEREKSLYEKRRDDMLARQQKAAALEEKWDKMQREITQKKTDILRQARNESAAMIRKARREAEEIIAELKEQFRDQGPKKRQQVIQGMRARLQEAAADMRPEFSSNPMYREKVDLASLRSGDTVYVPSLDQKGQVVSVRGKKIEVQLGNIKTMIKSDDCRRVRTGQAQEAPAARKESAAAIFLQKTASIGREIDIRGMMVDEGEACVGKFLDDALLAGLKQVLIIHGKGTGALRQGIHGFLKGHRNVQSFRFADAGEGGAGATVVDLQNG